MPVPTSPPTMLARLNQPISFRRKPAAQPEPSRAPRRAPRLQRPHRVRNLVGLEIEAGQLVAAKCHVNGRVVVEKAVGTPIPPNLVRDGEVTDLDALTTAIAELFSGS